MRLRAAVAADLPFLERMLLEAYNWSGPRFTLAQLRTDETARRYLDAGQCSGLQAGGEGPRWEGRQARAVP